MLQIFLFIMAIHGLQATSNPATDCAQGLSFLPKQYQAAAVGRPVHDTETLDGTPYSGFLKQWESHLKLNNLDSVKDFHNDVLDLLIMHPDLRSALRNTFSKKYGFSAEDVRDIELYYAAAFFREFELYSANPQVAVRRLQDLFHQQRRINPQGIEKTIPYFEENLTHKSVPEMAQDRGVNERTVYAQLSLLGLSIEGAFKKPVGNELKEILANMGAHSISKHPA